MIAKKGQKQPKQYIDTNPIEAFRDIGGGVAKSLSSDLAKGAINDLWGQILGVDVEKSSKQFDGEMLMGQEIDFSGQSRKSKSEIPKAPVEPGYNYRRNILYGEEKTSRESSQEIQVQVQQIVIELKKLTSSSKELQTEFKQASVDQMPVNPGKYHVSFFEWLLATIRTARIRVEESANWLAMFSSKRKKKGYWERFKKEGTTFGLNNERTVATQTG